MRFALGVQIAVELHTDLKVYHIQHICAQFDQPLLIKEEGMWKQLGLGRPRELNHCFHKVPSLGLYCSAA